MSHYAESGVDHARKDAGLGGMIAHLRGTYDNNPRARVLGDIGHYASVIEISGSDMALAISTDSVGTKVLVAQMAGRHDTVGIDLVAMNANDVVCCGANPVALVDYIGVNVVDAAVMEEIAKGLAEGARRAEISIPGGEIAQVRELVKGHGDGPHYDLIGTCVGVVNAHRVIDGSGVEPGDAIVGISATGLHSNGFSLARKILFEVMKKGIHDELPDCGRSVADELLAPTGMYVKEAKALTRSGVPPKALFNITGGGFTNLLRVSAEGVGMRIDALPEPLPIFSLLQEAGGIGPAEMHQVFNMGIGFAAIVPQRRVSDVERAARANDKQAWVIGRVVADPQKRVVVTRPGLRGALVATKSKGAFVHADDVPAEHA
jgi:phosphoribosylformylglycinamidine cyclo-ligase